MEYAGWRIEKQVAEVKVGWCGGWIRQVRE